MAEHAEKTDKEKAPKSNGADTPANSHATEATSPYDAPTQSAPVANDAAAPAVPAFTVPEEKSTDSAKSKFDWREAKDGFIGLLAGVARWIGLIFALILVGHVIFVIAEANPDNAIVVFAREWSETLSIGFKDLFTPEDAKLKVLVNYGIAALFWLVVSAVVAKIIRKVGGAN